MIEPFNMIFRICGAVEYSVVYTKFILTIAYCDSDKSVCNYRDLHKTVACLVAI